MLKGTKFEDLKFLGAVIVHLTAERTFREIRVENAFINTVLTMDPLPRIKEVLDYKYLQIDREVKRKQLVENLKK